MTTEFRDEVGSELNQVRDVAAFSIHVFLVHHIKILRIVILCWLIMTIQTADKQKLNPTG